MAYSEEQIGTALAVLASNDGNVSHTRRLLKKQGWKRVPGRTTITRWYEKAATRTTERDRALSEKGQEKKAELANELEKLALTLAGDLLDDDRRKEASYKDLATTLGISIDKMALLRGEGEQTAGVVPASQQALNIVNQRIEQHYHA